MVELHGGGVDVRLEGILWTWTDREAFSNLQPNKEPPPRQLGWKGGARGRGLGRRRGCRKRALGGGGEAPGQMIQGEWGDRCVERRVGCRCSFRRAHMRTGAAGA
eukprot:scaffold27456_cov32-Tisochrysis_lutea.AAC.1